MALKNKSLNDTGDKVVKIDFKPSYLRFNELKSQSGYFIYKTKEPS